jgi:hypothetical protein
VLASGYETLGCGSLVARAFRFARRDEQWRPVGPTTSLCHLAVGTVVVLSPLALGSARCLDGSCPL